MRVKELTAARVWSENSRRGMELKKRNVRTSKTRVRRLMKNEGLYPVQKRRVRVRTTRSNPYLPVAPHLLLEAPPPKRPGERFYSDITYIPTQEGWRRPTGTRMAATLDGYSRKCAGWSAADNMETPLVLRAAQRAFAQAAQVTDHTDEAIIHHSDRGSRVPAGRVPMNCFVAFCSNTAWHKV